MDYTKTEHEATFKNELKNLNKAILEALPVQNEEALQESNLDSNWENSVNFQYFLTTIKKNSDYSKIDYLSIKDEFDPILKEQVSIKESAKETTNETDKTDNEWEFFDM